MIKKRVQAPDGSIYEVSVPEGAGTDEIIAAAQRMQASRQFLQSGANVNPTGRPQVNKSSPEGTPGKAVEAPAIKETIGSFAERIPNVSAILDAIVAQQKNADIRSGKDALLYGPKVAIPFIGNMLAGMVEERYGQAKRSAKAFKQGNMVSGVGQGLLTLTPAGPTIGLAAEQIGKGEIAKGVGTAIAGMLEAIPQVRGGQMLRENAPLRSSWAKKLYTSAERNIEQSIQPITKEGRAVVNALSPELKQYKISSVLPGKVDDKWRMLLAQKTKELEKADASIGPMERIDPAPMYEVLNEARGRLQQKLEGGKTVTFADEALAAIDMAEEKIKAMGPHPLARDVIAMRRLADNAVDQKGGFRETSSVADRASVIGDLLVGNAQRRALGKSRPDIAKINKEYSNIRKIVDVIDEREASRVGKTGVSFGSLGDDALSGLFGYAIGGAKGAAIVEVSNIARQTRGVRSMMGRAKVAAGKAIEPSPEFPKAGQKLLPPAQTQFMGPSGSTPPDTSGPIAMPPGQGVVFPGGSAGYPSGLVGGSRSVSSNPVLATVTDPITGTPKLVDVTELVRQFYGNTTVRRPKP